MRENSYEICIVGGGIAGSVLAYNLVPDFGVCLIERNSLDQVGRKPCGNAVHASWLENGGVEPKPSDLGAVSSRIDSIKLHFPDEELMVNLSPGREGLTLDRRGYIKGALESALDRGCDFFRGEAKALFHDGGIRGIKLNDAEFTAGVYVDASGPSAVLRRNFFPNPSDAFFLGYREIIDHRLDEKSWHVFQPHSDSVFWISPEDERTNVGGVAFRGGAGLKEDVGRFKEGKVRGKVLEEGFGLVPSFKPIDLVYGKVVAIGDAGLTANPITGGGIGPTVKASNLLAETLRNGKDLETFQDRHMREIASGYRRNYYLSRVLLKLQNFMWKRAAKWAFGKFYGGGPVE